MDRVYGHFEWAVLKEIANARKHDVDFVTAAEALSDRNAYIIFDADHSEDEDRFIGIGKAGGGILTVRFTIRGEMVRIIGAGYWRKGERIYYEEKRP